MTKVSRRWLDKELEARMSELFVKTISDLKHPVDISNFLEDLLSPAEQIMLVKRLGIAILLSRGYTYDAIDSTLKVFRPTIMNVSYWLRHGKGGYQRAVKKVEDDKKREELFDKIESILLEISPPKQYGSPSYERKRDQGRKLFKRRVIRNRL